ncbi:MCE family protein [Lapillicoccus jejuensis]|uniref:Phospholipid/cholesterol/gamma-HCH transport system substrate-binding protein n=1 Tax=Lapillicoccus jejuensis TaxID=402171 RepID=A0A542DWG0_9MICO|nr:MCE family protein [Lapillicoccus jejuensis]TQJ07433.1 phospholipid/cholesterol/gamma-HCH transport system substrate-binding protein [Lapillicoccus jejuensis]
MSTRRPLALAVAVLALLGLAGCSLGTQGVYDVPLPGGVAVGRDGYEVTAQFSDVLDLVPQAAVKLDDVPVGRVSHIGLGTDGKVADVTLLLRGDVDLPANTTARITQTSLLGEKYVALSRPSSAATGSLRSTRRIGVEGTSEAVDAERVLGALSLLLNGGGLAQFQEISKELAAVSSGRDADIRAFLTQMASFVKTLDTRKASITSALDSLDRLGRTLDANTTQLTTALAKLPPGLQVIADQRQQLVAMLAALDRLSTVTVSTLDRSRDAMVADLQRLDPILGQLAAAGQSLPASLQILATFPFPDSVLGAIKGDYVNTFLVTNLSTPGTTIPNDTSGAGWPSAYPGSCATDVPFAGCGTPAPVPSSSTGTGTGAATGTGTGTGTGTTTIGPPPMLLPPTSSVAPGLPTPVVTSTPTPTPTPTPSPTPTRTGGRG